MDGSLFLIGALPRTGSTWLSAILNLSPNCYCLHEGAAHFQDSLLELYNSKFKYVGDIGSEVMFPVYDDLNAKRVILLRKRDEIKKSLSRYFPAKVNGLNEAVDELDRIATEWIKKYNPLYVGFESLFKIATVENIWSYIMPDEKFPSKKVELFLKLNIQQKAPTEELLTLISLGITK